MKWLDVTVVAGHQVCADFVLQQGLDTRRRGIRVLPPIKSWSPETIRPAYMSSRTETVPQEVGALLLIVAQLLLRPLGKFDCAELIAARILAAASRHAIEQLLGMLQQPVRYATVDLQALRKEPRRIDVRQQRDLPVELFLLLPEQVRQRRIFNSLDRNQVQLPLQQRRVDRQRPVEKTRRLFESRPAKFPPGGLRVHGRRLQQQIERAGDLRQLPVDVEHRLHHRRRSGAW